VDRQGNVFICDRGNSRIVVLTPSLQLLFTVGALGTKPGEFNSPTGIAVDGQGNVYVADTVNHRIQKLAPLR
jgi:tripartite motif-containing protein 71